MVHTLYSKSSGYTLPIRSSDRIRCLLSLIEDAITAEGDKRTDPKAHTHAVIERAEKRAGAMMDRLAAIAEYIEDQP